jgi:hypothetical protein
MDFLQACWQRLVNAWDNKMLPCRSGITVFSPPAMSREYKLGNVAFFFVDKDRD